MTVSGGSAPSYYFSCPDDHHPHMIDLGLPSGTKWACCNVGAKKPEDYGGYYAWGETEEKTTYNWKTYIHCAGTWETCSNIGSDIAGTQYDVAHVKWGSSWMMPSKAQQDELRENCSSEWITVNGIDGRIFTGSNGGSIFFPAAGFRGEKSISFIQKNCFCWSSTRSSSNMWDYAYSLNLNTFFADWCNSERCSGQSVRPVSK